MFVLPESPCAVVAVPLMLVLHRNHPHPTKEQPKKGGVFIFVLFLRGFLSVAFVLRMWVYTRASCARGHLTNRRRHTHGGGHGPISFVFVVLFVSRTKIGPTKNLKIFISDPVLHAKDKTRHDVYTTASFLPSPMVSKLSMPCFVFIYLLTLINLHAK